MTNNVDKGEFQEDPQPTGYITFEGVPVRYVTAETRHGVGVPDSFKQGVNIDGELWLFEAKEGKR